MQENVVSGRMATIEDLLGVVSLAASTRLALAYSVEAGLPVSALDHLAEAVAPNDTRFKLG
jgi:uncharacterized protein (DUF2384 family)